MFSKRERVIYCRRLCTSDMLNQWHGEHSNRALLLPFGEQLCLHSFVHCRLRGISNTNKAAAAAAEAAAAAAAAALYATCAPYRSRMLDR